MPVFIKNFYKIKIMAWTFSILSHLLCISIATAILQRSPNDLDSSADISSLKISLDFTPEPDYKWNSTSKKKVGRSSTVKDTTNQILPSINQGVQKLPADNEQFPVEKSPDIVDENIDLQEHDSAVEDEKTRNSQQSPSKKSPDLEQNTSSEKKIDLPSEQKVITNQKNQNLSTNDKPISDIVDEKLDSSDSQKRDLVNKNKKTEQSSQQSLSTESSNSGQNTSFENDVIKPPIPINTPKPKYPKRAQRMGKTGNVLLMVKVLSSGNVEQVIIRTSSGHRQLDRAAQKAVYGWQFQPAYKNGKAICSWLEIPIEFQTVKKRKR